MLRAARPLPVTPVSDARAWRGHDVPYWSVVAWVGPLKDEIIMGTYLH
jgi:hypothetical protein